MSGGFPFLLQFLPIVVTCVALTLTLFPIASATSYTVCSSGCDYAGLQAASVITANVDDTITITEEGVYDGPLLVCIDMLMPGSYA